MAVETADDRAAMLADFGVVASWSGASFNGIFDNAYEAVDAGGSIPFALVRPRFYCRSADVSGAVEGDAIVVDGLNYIIRVVMPDGTGFTEMELEVV